MDNKKEISTGVERKLYDRILKYTGVFSSVQGVALVISVVLAKAKSLLLGPAGFGITENLNRTTDIIKNATNLGIQTVAVPEISVSTDEHQKALLSERILVTRSWALLTAIVGMAVCLVLAPLLSLWAFDGDNSYSFSFMALSLAVAATAVTGGETAILRGTGMLRQIALSQLLTGLVSLCISVPLYWFLRFDGIVPALALSAMGSTAVTCFYSCRRFPYRACPFSWKVLHQGTGMIGFGIYFTAAAFLGAWAWSFIARYLTEQGGTELTGMYSAGYMLVNYLMTLLLSVSDSEYYPRLSAAGNNMKEAHRIMDNQVRAMCMLAAPVVILFILCVPVMVYVALEYEKFQMSTTLAQMAVIGLFFKAVYQPVAYLVLARSDSRIYLMQEAICYILLITCVVMGYRMAGPLGIGLSFAVWEFSYLILTLIVSRLRYGFIMSLDSVRNILIQGSLVILAAVCVYAGFRMWLTCSIIICAVSILISLRFFYKHASFLTVLSSRLFRKS